MASYHHQAQGQSGFVFQQQQQSPQSQFPPQPQSQYQPQYSPQSPSHFSQPQFQAQGQPQLQSQSHYQPQIQYQQQPQPLRQPSPTRGRPLPLPAPGGPPPAVRGVPSRSGSLPPPGQAPVPAANYGGGGGYAYANPNPHLIRNPSQMQTMNRTNAPMQYAHPVGGYAPPQSGYAPPNPNQQPSYVNPQPTYVNQPSFAPRVPRAVPQPPPPQQQQQRVVPALYSSQPQTQPMPSRLQSKHQSIDLSSLSSRANSNTTTNGPTKWITTINPNAPLTPDARPPARALPTRRASPPRFTSNPPSPTKNPPSPTKEYPFPNSYPIPSAPNGRPLSSHSSSHAARPTHTPTHSYSTPSSHPASTSIHGNSASSQITTNSAKIPAPPAHPRSPRKEMKGLKEFPLPPEGFPPPPAHPASPTRRSFALPVGRSNSESSSTYDNESNSSSNTPTQTTQMVSTRSAPLPSYSLPPLQSPSAIGASAGGAPGQKFVPLWKRAQYSQPLAQPAPTTQPLSSSNHSNTAASTMNGESTARQGSPTRRPLPSAPSSSSINNISSRAPPSPTRSVHSMRFPLPPSPTKSSSAQSHPQPQQAQSQSTFSHHRREVDSNLEESSSSASSASEDGDDDEYQVRGRFDGRGGRDHKGKGKQRDPEDDDDPLSRPPPSPTYGIRDLPRRGAGTVPGKLPQPPAMGTGASSAFSVSGQRSGFSNASQFSQFSQGGGSNLPCPPTMQQGQTQSQSGQTPKPRPRSVVGLPQPPQQSQSHPLPHSPKQRPKSVIGAVGVGGLPSTPVMSRFGTQPSWEQGGGWEQKEGGGSSVGGSGMSATMRMAASGVSGGAFGHPQPQVRLSQQNQPGQPQPQPPSQFQSRGQTQPHAQYQSHQPQQSPRMPGGMPEVREMPREPPQTPQIAKISIAIESPAPLGGRDRRIAFGASGSGESTDSVVREFGNDQGGRHEVPQAPQIPFDAPQIQVHESPRVMVNSPPHITYSAPQVPQITFEEPTPQIPQINIEMEKPRVPQISFDPPTPQISFDAPQINVSGDTNGNQNPRIEFEVPGIAFHSPQAPVVSSSGSASRPQSAAPSAFSARSGAGSRNNGGGLTCATCRLPILGRIISAMARKFHPGCFRCAVCEELLEHVSSYEGPAKEGEEEGKAYCHLDYHELFAPRCYTCRTPIIDENFISLNDPELGGTRTYHKEHFFCAECGDPFLDPSSATNLSNTNSSQGGGYEDTEAGVGENFVVYKGHPYCSSCHVRLRLPKCKKCKKSIRDHVQAVEALGGKWCWECFCCERCNKPFEDPAFFERDKKPYCEECFSVILRNEV